DGTVVVVRYVPRRTTGGKPFLSAGHWDLTPSSDFFRVREIQIPARRVGKNGDPPAVTMRDGKVGANNWTNAFGGEAKTFFEPGEIVRLVRLNAAFNIVRMDVEAVCRPAAFGRRLRGRVDVVLSGQINAATFDEANRAVGQVLEPIELARVMEVCDPETAQSPLVIRRGTPVKLMEQRLGEPNGTEDGVFDFGTVRLRIQNGVVEKIMVPAID
ncbi:MAG: hypothetical protein ACXW2Q_03445, partial [Thermoanaerobaculia bacterium]